MTKKPKQYVIAEGYPWYLYDQNDGYTKLTLMDGPNRQEGRRPVEFKLKWGAWKKVRVLIQEVK